MEENLGTGVKLLLDTEGLVEEKKDSEGKKRDKSEKQGTTIVGPCAPE